MTEAGSNSRKDRGGSHRHQEHRERVGNYVVGGEIGRGSFATVYKGHRSKSKTSVAIKAVSRQKLTSKLLDNLESEINILKVISNRNIVALLDCFKNDSHIYLVMEYCSGADLSFYLRYRGRIDSLDFIPRVYESNMVASRTEGKVFWPHPETGGLDERVTRCFLGQLAQAVRFLRSQDLIHRDIKPQNLLLQPATAAEIAEGQPLGIPILKVADFGFARILPAATMAETLCGSPLYMAPEILRYEKYDAKADLWSVGAVLYEMCVGKSPFRAPNHVELLRRIEKGDDRIKFPDESSRQQAPTADGSAPPRITRVSPDLKELIRGLLKQRPAERMGFDAFFASGVWEGYMTESVGDVSTSIEVSTDSSSAGDQFMSGLASQHASEGAKSSTHAAAPSPPSPQTSPAPAPAPPTAGSIPKRQESRVALGEASRTSSNAPTPVPRASRPAPTRRSEPKYYVGDEPAEPELEPSAPPQTNMNSSKTDTRIIPSRVHSRLERAASSGDDASPVTPIAAAPIYAARAIGGSPLAATPPITSTGKEDSVLGGSDSKEYVVVEKRTVEINELADELQQKVSRRPSSGSALVRPSAAKRNSIVARPVSSFKPSGGSPPSPQASYGGQTGASYSPPFAFGTTPPFAVPAVRGALSRPRQPSLPATPPVFPPPGAYGISPERHVTPSQSPSNALARVLTNTAVKLLNSSANTAVNAIALATGTSVRRWPQIERSVEIDPQENDVLDLLEDAARKAFVLFDLADSRLLQMQVGRQAVPSVSATLTPAPSTPPPGTAPPPFSVPPVRRKSSSSSTSSDLLVLRQAEEAASDACALYFKSLAFICAGHERFKKYWDARKVRNIEYQTSAELNEMVQWFRARFNEVYEKAEWSKARCAEQLPDVDKLVHGRARDISRQSAQAELMGDLAVAEEGYDTAMWLLGTLLDDAMYEGVSVRDEDRVLYEHLIGSISDRLDGLRKKMDAARAGVGPTAAHVSARVERI